MGRDKEQVNYYLSFRADKYAPKISGYAGTKGEYFAESFVALQKGKLNKIDPEFVKALSAKQAVKTTQVGQKIAFVVPDYIKQMEVKLPKEEYARVMSEVRTWATEKEKTKGIFSKGILDNNYVIYYEPNTMDFIIIGKDPLKE